VFGISTISLLAAASIAQPLFRQDAVLGLPGTAADLLAFQANGDSRVDLAAAHGAIAQVSVLLGRDLPGGEVGFTSRVHAVGTSPVAVEAADLNGDGAPDLGVVNSGSASLTVLLGGPAGAFQYGGETPLDIGPRFVRFADLDRDGDLDAATVNFLAEGKGSMNVLLGDGRGSFPASTRRDIGDNPHAFLLADVDGDALTDAAVGHTDALSLFRGRGDGGFAEPVATDVRGGPAAVVAGDQDGDGKLDLVFLVANFGDNNAELVFATHQGAGRFATAIVSREAGRGTRPGGGPTGLLELADLNGDLLEDLVTEADIGQGSALRVHLSLGDGTFQRVVEDLRLREGFTDLLFADCSQDGIDDLCLATVSGRLAVLPAVTVGQFDPGNPVIELDSGPREVTGFDPDLDGESDLLVRSSSFLHALRRRQARSFLPPAKLTGVRSLQAMALGQLDGDGIIDIAASDLAAGAVGLHFLDQAGQIRRSVDRRARGAPGPLVAGDFDADRQADLAVTDLNAPEVTIFIDPANDATGRQVEASVGAGQTAIAAGDLDADGALDLAVATREGLRLLLGDGRGDFPRRRELALLAAARWLAVADVDGDGAADVLGVAELGRSLGFARALRGPGEPEMALVSELQEFQMASTGDLDGDGLIDIAAASSRPLSGLSVYRGKGGGAFAEPEKYAAGADVRAFGLVDLDRDGALDAAVAALSSRTVTVLWGLPRAGVRRFVRGDTDRDLSLTITDVVLTLRGLFQGGGRPPCEDAADADDSGEVNLSDALSTLNFLFLGGPPPPPPFPGAGPDPSEDGLDCAGA
jgi:hypothetical protein